jgi:hypothetical protein
MGLALRLVVFFYGRGWQAVYRKQIPRDRGRSDGRSTNLERTYYIVPPGMNVIFRDEYGNELKR